jgi:hypothetical protein
MSATLLSLQLTDVSHTGPTLIFTVYIDTKTSRILLHTFVFHSGGGGGGGDGLLD